MAAVPKVYLIPSLLDELATHVFPPYILSAITECSVLFVENERSARRFIKSIDKKIIIDNYQWHTIGKMEESTLSAFKDELQKGKTIGIISDAGCPGIADPGQLLIAAAQELGAIVKPLVGPNSILLSLMASGMNGQQFHFAGYLPIDQAGRIKKIKELETESLIKKSTQVFIETPYRNNQLIESILITCKPSTRFCIAVDLTGPKEEIRTKTISEWKKGIPDINKRPAIFLLQA